jgi:hypothetical protein
VSTLVSDFTPWSDLDAIKGADIDQRGPTVAFNPVKGGEIIAALAKEAKWAEFIPLAGMNRAGVMDKLAQTAVYLDLGHHPGKDRMPREAALAGAMVLTARRGAAANHQDMPIPWSHKIAMNRNPVLEARDRLNFVFKDIKTEWIAQGPYRTFVRNERDRFRGEVASAFIHGRWGNDIPGGDVTSSLG